MVSTTKRENRSRSTVRHVSVWAVTKLSATNTFAPVLLQIKLLSMEVGQYQVYNCCQLEQTLVETCLYYKLYLLEFQINLTSLISWINPLRWNNRCKWSPGNFGVHMWRWQTDYKGGQQVGRTSCSGQGWNRGHSGGIKDEECLKMFWDSLFWSSSALDNVGCRFTLTYLRALENSYSLEEDIILLRDLLSSWFYEL